MWQATVGLLLAASCHGTAPNLDAVLWVRTSAEYRAAAEQAYHLARIQLERNLDSASPSWSAALEQAAECSGLDLAVVMDVDDTVLDSSPFQAYLISRNAEFRSDLWEAWVREGRAQAVPGALDFLRSVHAQGIKIFYVSNREVHLEEATVRNLQALGFPVDPGGADVLSKDERPDWGLDKRSRRQFVATTHRVLLIVGDDLNDFLSVPKDDPQARMDATRAHQAYWGVKWILMPNPMYGRWRRAVYGSAESLSREEIQRRINEQFPAAQ
jgi:acid phosphatase